VFSSAAACAAWAGVCLGNNESAGKCRSGCLRPGNPTLRATLAECANGAAHTKGIQFQCYHGALQARLGYKKAILAVTHKLLRVVYVVLREGEPYHDPKFDYHKLVVDRHAPRWLRDLKQYGHLAEAQLRHQYRPAVHVAIDRGCPGAVRARCTRGHIADCASSPGRGHTPTVCRPREYFTARQPSLPLFNSGRLKEMCCSRVEGVAVSSFGHRAGASVSA